MPYNSSAMYLTNQNMFFYKAADRNTQTYKVWEVLGGASDRNPLDIPPCPLNGKDFFLNPPFDLFLSTLYFEITVKLPNTNTLPFFVRFLIPDSMSVSR